MIGIEVWLGYGQGLRIAEGYGGWRMVNSEAKGPLKADKPGLHFVSDSREVLDSGLQWSGRGWKTSTITAVSKTQISWRSEKEFPWFGSKPTALVGEGSGPRRAPQIPRSGYRVYGTGYPVIPALTSAPLTPRVEWGAKQRPAPSRTNNEHLGFQDFLERRTLELRFVLRTWFA
jgi:hypothetical protein